MARESRSNDLRGSFPVAARNYHLFHGLVEHAHRCLESEPAYRVWSEAMIACNLSKTMAGQQASGSHAL